MINAKLKKQSNKLSTLIGKLNKIHNQQVQVGHFAEQGAHPTIGISYVALMQKHHTGYVWTQKDKIVPPRPVLTILKFKLQNLRDVGIRRHINKWLKSKFTLSDNKEMLEKIALRIGRLEKRIFGDTSLLESNALLTQLQKGGFDSPLVKTKELRNATSFKTSLDPAIKKVK